MPIRATINGELWEFDTVAEAAEFRRTVAKNAVPPTAKSSSPPIARRVARRTSRAVHTPARRNANKRAAMTRGSGLSERSRQILDAVRQKPEGQQSEEFAHAIGGSSAKSLPPRMMMLGKELKALGLKPNDVIHRKRIYVKGRAKSIFKPGPRLDDALRRTGDLFRE